MGNRGIAPRILNIGTRWKWVAASCSGHFIRRRNSRLYPLARRPSGSKDRSGHSGGEERKKFHHYPCRKLNPGRSALSLVTILTEGLHIVVPIRYFLVHPQNGEEDICE